MMYLPGDEGRSRDEELPPELEYCDDRLCGPWSLNLYIPSSLLVGQRIPLVSLLNPATQSYKSRKKSIVVGLTWSLCGRRPYTSEDDQKLNKSKNACWAT